MCDSSSQKTPFCHKFHTLGPRRTFRRTIRRKFRQIFRYFGEFGTHVGIVVGRIMSIRCIVGRNFGGIFMQIFGRIFGRIFFSLGPNRYGTRFVRLFVKKMAFLAFSSNSHAPSWSSSPFHTFSSVLHSLNSRSTFLSV
jgi:hypothetical protein